MCSGDAAKTIVDPGNFFGARPGGMDYAGMLDPGGEISNEVEGKKDGKDSWNRKSARKGAFGLLPDDPVVDEAYAPMTDAQRQSRTTTAINTDRSTRFYR